MITGIIFFGSFLWILWSLLRIGIYFLGFGSNDGYDLNAAIIGIPICIFALFFPEIVFWTLVSIGALLVAVAD